MDRWVVDDEYPQGHAIPMDDDEVAQRDQDVAAWGILAEIEQRAADAVEAHAEALRDARTAIATGALFSSLTGAEREVIDLLLAADQRRN